MSKEEKAEKQDASEEKKYSKAELKKMREETVAFYQDEIQVLELQAKYEGLLAEVEENQLRQMVAVSRKLQIMAPPPQTQDDMPENNDPAADKKQSRSLKTS